MFYGEDSVVVDSLFVGALIFFISFFLGVGGGVLTLLKKTIF